MTEISQDAAAARFSAGLKLFVGRERLHSVEMVATAASVSVSAVEKYMCGQATPGLAALLRILAVMPESFANHLLELAGLSGAYRMGDGNVIPAAALADQLDAASKLADALKDGNINHQERLALAPVMRALGSRMSELAAQWERERG